MWQACKDHIAKAGNQGVCIEAITKHQELLVSCQRRRYEEVWKVNAFLWWAIVTREAVHSSAVDDVAYQARLREATKQQQARDSPKLIIVCQHMSSPSSSSYATPQAHHRIAAYIPPKLTVPLCHCAPVPCIFTLPVRTLPGHPPPSSDVHLHPPPLTLLRGTGARGDRKSAE